MNRAPGNLCGVRLQGACVHSLSSVAGLSLSGSSSLFLPALLAELNGCYTGPDGRQYRRLASIPFYLEDPSDQESFLKGDFREAAIPGTMRKVKYDPLQRIGIGLTRLGTRRAVAIGTYAFALQNLRRDSLTSFDEGSFGPAAAG